MNKSFRSVWSQARQTWVAVAEIVMARGKPSSAATLRGAAGLVVSCGLVLSLGCPAALAQAPTQLQAQTAALAPPTPKLAQPSATTLPTGGQVSAGSANIAQSGANMTINQSTNRAAIDWQSFNVGADAKVQFVQPGANSVTLNRVLGADPSQIFGRIEANGQVILTNPQGIYFAPGSRVDVGGIVATTSSIGNDEFMAGESRYTRNGSTASVVNEGEIRARLGGYVALLAPEVRNQGAIIAHQGTVALASGEVVDLHFDSNDRLTSLRVEASAIQALVENRYAIEAPGGLIILAAQALDRLQGGVVKNSGTLSATSLTAKGGRIVLEADAITLASGSRVDASGATGGGEVLVGGDWQGSGAMHQATTVTMEAGASIDASATRQGDGGQVVLWSDVHQAGSVTDVAGTVLAQGAGPGHGGQIETSGHKLKVEGSQVNAGKGGLWLLDPYNVTISNGGSDTGGSGVSGSTGGTWTPSASGSNISNTTLNAALNNGQNVTITTSGAGADAGNITVNGAINKTAGASSTLTLAADNSIVLNAGISSSSGTLATTLTATAGSVSGGGAINTHGGLLSVSQAGAGELSGVISGTGALTKNAAGALTLTGANSYTGATTVNAGNLTIRPPNFSTVSGTTFNVNGASTLTFDSLGGLFLSPNTVIAFDAVGGGTVDFTGIQVGGGVNMTPGDLRIASNGGVQNLVKSSTGIGLNIDVHTLTLDVAAGGGGLLVDSVLWNNGSLVKSGAGTATLSGANWYNGPTTINAGTLSVGGAGSLSGGSYTQNIAIASGATFDYASSAAQSLSGVVSGAGGLSKNGNGTLTMIGASTYFGGSTVNSGVLRAGVATTGSVSTGPFGTGAVTVHVSGAVDVNGKNIANAFSLAGSGVSGSGALYNSTATAATLNGAITLTADAAINSTAGASLTLGGAINGGHALTVTTAGASDGAYTQNGIVGGTAALSAYNVNSGTAALALAGVSTVAGPISVHGGVVALSADMTSTATTGTGISINGSRITQAAGVDVATSGADIEYQVPQAAFTAGTDYAISLSGGSGNRATINAGGGNVTLNAAYAASGTAGGGDDALQAFYADISTTGTGAISLTGDASHLSNTSGNNAWGAFLGYSTITTNSGAISLTGTGGSAAATSSIGVVVNGADLKLLSSSGPISVTGQTPTGFVGSYTGLYLNPSTSANLVIGADGATVPSSTSNITVSADKANFLANGAYVLQLNTAGAVVLESNAASFGSTMSTANLAITGNPSSIRIGKTTNTADVTVGRALSAAGPISIYGGNLNLNANLSSTASGAAILAKASGDIVQASSVAVHTLAGDVTYWADSDASGEGAIRLQSSASVASTGGNVFLGGGSALATGYAASTNGGAYGNGVELSAGATVAAGAGNVTLRGQGRDAGSYSDGVRINGAGAAVSGGNITLVGLGSSVGSAGVKRGVDLETGATVTGTGLVSVTGSGGVVSGSDNYGVSLDGTGTAITATGTGSVSINGTGGGTGASARDYGVLISGNASVASASGPTAITGTGGTATGVDPIGVYLTSGSINSAGGSISVTGTSGAYASGASNNAGIQLTGTASIGNHSGGGSITLTGTDANAAPARGIRSTAGSIGGAGFSGDVALHANELLVTALSVTSTGALTVDSTSAAFNGAFSTTGWTLASGLSGLTLGKSGNSADVSIAGATSIAGPISIYGGNITLNAGLSATGSNTISLTGTGNVTEGASGYVVADKLALLGGNVTLTNASNAVGTLAASGVSGLTYSDSNALTVGTVGAASGVSATGAVSLGTATGDLTLAQNLSTSNASSSALVLNAGINAAAGTATGGNIVLSGSPTISVGSGGTAKLYSGSVAGSTGLSALVGSGSGRFRYDSDESASNFVQALGTGLNAVYREQPTITTVTVNDQAITYGDATPTWTYTLSGGQNGDTLAQAFSGGPSVTVGGSTSTSGHFAAGSSHTVSASGGLGSSLLGYANTASGYVGGSLTVNQKTLSVGYTGVNKTYDGGTSATVTTGDDRVTNDVLSITRTAAFADKNANNGVVVNVSGVSLSGSDASNYTLAATSGSTAANITPKTVNLSASKTYDGSTGLTGDVSVITGIVSETLSYTGATANIAHVAVANKYINAITLADASDGSGGLASNYQLPTLDAAHAPVSISTQTLSASASLSGTLTKVYDGSTSVASGTAHVGGSVIGAVGGDTLALDTSGVSLAYDTAHVATATQIGVASGSVGLGINSSVGSLASDYSFSAPTIANVTAHITPATLTPTLTNSGVTKTYDGNTNAPSGFTPSYSFYGLVSGDTTASLSHSGAQYDSQNVLAASKVTVSGLAVTGITGSHSSASSDYVLDATAKDVAASVTPKTVGVSASKTYDGSTSLSGDVNVITGIGSETLSYTGATANNAHVAVASKYINAITLADATDGSGGLASNYQLPTLDAAHAPVVISTQTLSATASLNGTLSKVYDGSTSVASGTASVGGSVAGAVGGDTLTLDASGITLAYDTAHVATATQISVASGAVGLNINSSVGSLASDYSFSAPSVAAVTAHITPATLTATVTNSGVTKTYDGNTNAPSGFTPSYSYAGLVSGDTTASLSNTSATYDSQNVLAASKLTVAGLAITGITGSHNSAASDYVLDATAKDVAASVTPKTVGVSASKTYDGSTSLAGDVSVITGVGSETLSYTGATANNAHVAVANKYINAITLADASDGSGGLSSNYQLPTLDAAHAPVGIGTQTLSASASLSGTLTKVYDGNTSVASSTTSVNGSVVGAVGGDTLTLDASGVTLAYDTAHVATATQVSASGSIGLGINSSVGSLASDYSYSAPSVAAVTAHITPAPLTLSLTNTGVTRTYDGTRDAPVGFRPSWSAANLVGGDSAVSVASTGAAYNSKDVAAANTLSVSGLGLNGITGSLGSAASDYALTASHADVVASVTPKSLSVSGLAVANKTYDGTTYASVTDWGSVNTGVGSEALALNAQGASFSDANAANAKLVTATGYALADGANGGLASNYQLSSHSATTTADIAKATLTVIANDDAKFVTQADSTGYNGVSYSGFVHGETSAVLSGAAGVSRDNSSVNSAGIYNGVLAPDTSGLAASNYSFLLQNGSYTVVAANQLLVRVNNTSTVYGSAPSYTITSAGYANAGAVVPLAAITPNGDGSFTVSDGVGGMATFTLTPAQASLSGAGKTAAGSYQLTAAGVSTTNAHNFGDTLTVVGSETVIPKGVSANANGGISKVYDGNTAMTGLSIALTGVEAGDVVTSSGNGAFATPHAGSQLGYAISNLALNGTDAGNYTLTAGHSLSGSNGQIVAKTLTATATVGGTLSKTYDGTATATGASVSGTVLGAVSGDTLALDSSGLALAYNSAHVADANSIHATGSAGLLIANTTSGSLSSDYSLTQPSIANAAASITPASLSATLTNTGVSKVYDGSTAAPANFTPSWNITGLVVGDTAASLSHTSAAYNSKDVLSASQLTVAGLGISAIAGGNHSAASDYVLAASHQDVAAQITPKTVSANTSSGPSKVYDGSTAMNGLGLALAGLVGQDDVTASGVGAFDTRHAGSQLGYTVSSVALGGADAANYSLAVNSFTGHNGEITARLVTLTPQAATKVYDGQIAYSLSVADLALLTAQLGVSGDSVSAASAVFSDKNVGTGKTLTATSVLINDGNGGGDYLVSLGHNNASSITRLGSVTWVGGSTGNWFDPANWAGGAVPDLSNVANVVIAGASMVSLGGTLVAPAASGAVNIDSLSGSGGHLSQGDGVLNVGAGGITLGSLTQSGGTLSNAGSTTVDRATLSGGSYTGTGTMTAAHFTQTGGVTTLSQTLTVTQDFSQSGNGSLSAGSDVRISDTVGGVQLGKLNSAGSLTVTSTDGALVQAPGTAITAQGSSSFVATQAGLPADIRLANAGNDFQGPVSLSGSNVAVSDANGLKLARVITTGDLSLTSHGALDLGTSSVGGALNAASGGGNLTQTGALAVTQAANFNAGTGWVMLPLSGNDLGNGFTVTASAFTITGDKLAAAANSVTAAVAATLSSAGASNAGMNFATQTSTAPWVLSVDLLGSSADAAFERVGVSLPKGAAVSGHGLSFMLPMAVRASQGDDATTAQASLPDGSPLPAWLIFKAQDMAFTAVAVPDGAFPLQVLVSWGSRQVMVLISERSE